MISYNKSKIILKKSTIRLGEELINTNKCLNRVTSENIYVHSYYPSENNAAFDGYAIKSEDTHKLNKKIQCECLPIREVVFSKIVTLSQSEP